MDVAEGVLAPHVVTVSWAAATAAIAVGVRRLDSAAIARAAVLSFLARPAPELLPGGLPRCRGNER